MERILEGFVLAGGSALVSILDGGDLETLLPV